MIALRCSRVAGLAGGNGRRIVLRLTALICGPGLHQVGMDC
jgi:hypothetical protein